MVITVSVTQDPHVPMTAKAFAPSPTLKEFLVSNPAGKVRGSLLANTRAQEKGNHLVARSRPDCWRTTFHSESEMPRQRRRSRCAAGRSP